MPNLINNIGNVSNALAQNYRKSSPSTRFGTPELVQIQITVNNVDCRDYDTVDGNFYNLISIVQKFAEIYAIGQVQYGGDVSTVTILAKSGTVTDPAFSRAPEANGLEYGATGDNYEPVNSGALSLDHDLTVFFDEGVSVNYTTMYGLGYI